mmetsp:Transcript_5795/g.21907  ORF Transcript_5795/g.21907 Transcript_5795/m.21907 type:complete len:87 (-) Transcript_5795:284-544(-)
MPCVLDSQQDARMVVCFVENEWLSAVHMQGGGQVFRMQMLTDRAMLFRFPIHLWLALHALMCHMRRQFTRQSHSANRSTQKKYSPL